MTLEFNTRVHNIKFYSFGFNYSDYYMPMARWINLAKVMDGHTYEGHV